jgi:hypothetical protein
MEIDVAVTTADVRDARWAWYFRTTFGRVLTALLVLFVFLASAQLMRGEVALARTNITFVLVLLLVPLAIGFAGLRSPAVKRFTEAPVHYVFSDDGVTVRMARAEATFTWSEIKRSIETSRYFVLVGGGAFQILPKRDMSAPVIADVRTLLAKH